MNNEMRACRKLHPDLADGEVVKSRYVSMIYSGTSILSRRVEIPEDSDIVTVTVSRGHRVPSLAPLIG